MEAGLGIAGLGSLIGNCLIPNWLDQSAPFLLPFRRGAESVWYTHAMTSDDVTFYLLSAALVGLVVIIFGRASKRSRPNYHEDLAQEQEHLFAIWEENRRKARAAETRHLRLPAMDAILRHREKRSPDEIEADRAAYLAQEQFFSRIRWQTHLSVEECDRLSRQPIRGMTEHVLQDMLNDQRHSCFYCASPIAIGGLHRDHLIPLAQLGPNHISNIVLACPGCNLTKGSRDPFEFVRSTNRVLRPSDELQRDIASRVTAMRECVPIWSSLMK